MAATESDFLARVRRRAARARQGFETDDDEDRPGFAGAEANLATRAPEQTRLRPATARPDRVPPEQEPSFVDRVRARAREVQTSALDSPERGPTEFTPAQQDLVGRMVEQVRTRNPRLSPVLRPVRSSRPLTTATPPPGLRRTAVREAERTTPLSRTAQAPHNQFMQGVVAGLSSAEVGVGEALESVGMEDRGEAMSRRGRERQARNAGRVSRIEDIHSLRDFRDWAAFTMGQGLGSTAAPVAGGLVGAAVAGPVGSAAGVTAATATTIGATAGALGPSYTLILGEIRGELEEAGVDPGAIDRVAPIVAIPAAALEAVLPATLGRRAISGAASRFGRGLALLIARRTLEGTLTEGLTEAGQTAITRGTTASLSENVDFLTDETLSELVNSALAGALPGAAFGAGGAAIEGRGRRSGAASPEGATPSFVERVRARAASGVGEPGGEMAAAVPEASAPPASVAPASAVTPAAREGLPAYYVNPADDVDIEPARFQYKEPTNARTGETGALRDVTVWKPESAGIVQVWRDPADSRLKVVNGHQRVNKARELGVGQMLALEIDAPSADEARTVGALTNIAEGSGTAVDAAKLIRQKGLSVEQLRATGVPLTGKIARDGLALANLHDGLFDLVARGQQPIERMAVIGRSGLTPDQQLALFEMVKRQDERVTNAEVEELARFVRSAESERVNQETLFGNETFAESLALEKARLSAWAKGQLRKQARLFSFVSKGERAEQIERAGVGTIDAAAAGALGSEASQVAEVYERLSASMGPVSDALNRATKAIRRGENENAVRAQLLEEARLAVQETLRGGAAPGGAGGSPAPRRDAGALPPDAREADQATAGEVAPLLDTGPDLFGEISQRPGRQSELIQERHGPQGVSAALDAARSVVSSLQGKVERGAASADEVRRYQEARSFIRRTEGRGLDAGELARQREGSSRTASDPDTADLFQEDREAEGLGASPESPIGGGESLPAEVSVGGATRTLRPIAPVELVRLANELLEGYRVFVRRYPKSRGAFYPDPINPKIGLDPSLGADPQQFARTLAHEIGHLVDFVPEKTMKRGNILGRIASLRSHLAETIDALPTDPSRALQPSDRARIRRDAEKRAGVRPGEDATADLASWRERVRRGYAGLIEDEMEARNLLGKERVQEELLLLTEWWRPYDPATASPSYGRYRESSKELYADALSVLLNSPGSLQARAPQFFDAFLGYLDQKPQVQESYDEIQRLLAGGEQGIYQARRAELEADFRRGEEIQRSAEGREDPQSTIAYLKQLFVSRAAPVVDAESRRQKGRPAHSAERSVKMAVQEFNHGDNRNRLLLMDIDRDVQKPMRAAGIDEESAGMYLMLHRIAEGDRGGMAQQARDAIMELTGESTWEAARAAYASGSPSAATDENARTGGAPGFDRDLLELAETGTLNPHGYTPDEARRQLDGMKDELGAENYGVLEESMRALRAILFRGVEEAVQVGAYSREVFETRILPNRETYAPFAVLDYFNGRMPAGIRRQMGTVRGIANPYATAILKGMTLNRLVEHQKVKQAILDVLDRDFPGQGAEQRVDKFTREKPAGPGRANLTYLVDGKLRYREVDEYIAKVLEASDLGWAGRLVKTVTSKTYGFFHPLYVSWSLAWQARNVQRDIKRTYKNLAAAHAGSPTYRQALEAVLDVGRLAQAYAETASSAWKNARRRDDTLIREMLEDRALGRAFHSFEPVESDRTHERLMQRYGIMAPERDGVAGLFTPLGRGIETLGVFQETWSKAAAYKLLGERGIEGRERAYMVRNYVGTPDSSDRGLASDVTNGVYLYANVIMAGLRADAEVAVQPSTAAGYWMRSVAIDFAPKMLMAAAVAGWLGDELKEWFERIPSYDLEKYLILPIPPFWSENERGDRKAIYLRVPHDDTNRILAAATWALTMEQRPYAPSHAMGVLAGEFPGLNPGLDMALKWRKALSGENPYDSWLGRSVVPRTEWEAGGWPRTREMLRWTLGEFGIVSQVLGRWTYGGPEMPGEAASGEKLLRSIPGLSALVRISDRGLDEERYWELDVEAQMRAQLRADLGSEVRDAVSERNRLNRWGDERLSDAERARRRQLNLWYRLRYLPLTSEMEAARDADDDDAYQAVLATLNGSLNAPVTVSSSRGRPARPARPTRSARSQR